MNNMDLSLQAHSNVNDIPKILVIQDANDADPDIELPPGEDSVNSKEDNPAKLNELITSLSQPKPESVHHSDGMEDSVEESEMERTR